MKSFSSALCLGFLASINQALAAEKGMPQLNTEYWPSQIFWLIIVFSFLYIVIWKIFLPKIINNIENRKLRVVNDLNETQKLKEEAEKKLAEYKKIIENSKIEAKKILEENKKKLNIDIENKKNKFNEEIEKELLSAEKEISNLKKSSLANINKIAIETSSEIIKEIIGSSINMSNVTAIVENISKKKVEKNL
tara:strand:+ start:289 stop:867 length:579 start_codon:yes stop_codon:yes gene_type:complete